MQIKKITAVIAIWISDSHHWGRHGKTTMCQLFWINFWNHTIFTLYKRLFVLMARFAKCEMYCHIFQIGWKEWRRKSSIWPELTPPTSQVKLRHGTIGVNFARWKIYSLNLWYGIFVNKWFYSKTLSTSQGFIQLKQPIVDTWPRIKAMLIRAEFFSFLWLHHTKHNCFIKHCDQATKLSNSFQSLDVGEGRSGNLLTLGSRKELDCIVDHINEQFRQKVMWWQQKQT